MANPQMRPAQSCFTPDFIHSPCDSQREHVTPHSCSLNQGPVPVQKALEASMGPFQLDLVILAVDLDHKRDFIHDPTPHPAALLPVPSFSSRTQPAPLRHSPRPQSPAPQT